LSNPFPLFTLLSFYENGAKTETPKTQSQQQPARNLLLLPMQKPQTFQQLLAYLSKNVDGNSWGILGYQPTSTD
jgi:hypothetical protein